MVFLGELPISDGDRKVHGRVGYASQQAWIFSGTVKENIVFGQEFNKDRYLEVIEACALQKVGNCMMFSPRDREPFLSRIKPLISVPIKVLLQLIFPVHSALWLAKPPFSLPMCFLTDSCLLSSRLLV